MCVAGALLAGIGMRRPQAGERLDEGRIVDRFEGEFLHPLPDLAVPVESLLDLLGGGMLGGHASISGRSRAAVRAHRFGHQPDRPHRRIQVRQQESLQAQGMHEPQRLGAGFVAPEPDPRAEEGVVKALVDLRDPGHGLERLLILAAIAERQDVVDRAPLEAH
jgi:hypothetical protein